VRSLSGGFALARCCGVDVVFADLGDWGEAELLSEYDATIPEIRINLRCVSGLPQSKVERFVTLAVAHELYHHGEAIGAVPRLRARKAREAAADRFARALLRNGD
jgi:hypothetical protein